MYFNLIVLTVLTGLARRAFGAPGGAGLDEYQYSSTRCFTTMTNKPWPYKTQWSTTPAQCTSTQTVTTTVTATSPVVTITDTSSTVVTASTSTETDTSTIINTSTTSTTTTETTTTVTVTSLVGTFTPVLDSLPDSSYSGSGGAVVKRDLLDALNGNTGTGNRVSTSRDRYPKEVTCYHYKQPKCITTTTVTTTIPASTKKTTTITDTSTTYPSATTTVTTTTTSVTTTTFTSTPSSTTTSTVLPTANCSPDNFADEISGQGIAGAYPDFGYSYATRVAVTATDAQDCCIAALTVADAQVFEYNVFPPGIMDNCAIYSSATGPCSSQSNEQWVVDTEPGAPAYTLGNLACGEFVGG